MLRYGNMRNRKKVETLQWISIMVSVVVIMLFMNMITSPQYSLVGNVVTAIETLKETDTTQKLSVLAFVVGLMGVLAVVYVYLRKYDVPMQGGMY